MNVDNILINVIAPLIFIVLLVIIVITIVLKVINKNIKEENKKVKQLVAIDNKYKDIDTSIIYKEMDLAKVKDAEEIKKMLFDMYKVLMKAFSNQDVKTLKELTSTTLYNSYLERIEALKKECEQEVIKNITLNEIRIIDIKKNKGKYSMKFYLNINCYDYRVDKKSKITMRGFDDRKVNQEFLVYLDKEEEHFIINKVTKVGQKTLNKEIRHGKKK